MTILRVVTDINVGDFPTDETLEKVAESMRVYANGTVTGQVLQETDKVSFSHGHVHVSNNDRSCATCHHLSIDGRS